MSVKSKYNKHVAELPFGLYNAHLLSVDECESRLTMPKADGSPPDPVAWQWTFRIADGPHEASELSGITSRTYSMKSKSFAWAAALGHPGGGADFDASLIEGKPCKIKVDVQDSKSGDGSTWNTILDVTKADEGARAFEVTAITLV